MINHTCNVADLEFRRLLDSWEPMSPLRACKCDWHDPEASWHGSTCGYTFHRCNCPDCKSAIRAWHGTPTGRASKRRANNVRRARVLGVQHEAYDPTSIFERDNWTCGICGQAIDPDLRWPEPLSASLDHILPVSRGGADVEHNVQAAHLRCNQRKGARPGLPSSQVS